MKNNKFLIALALCLGLSYAASFCSYNPYQQPTFQTLLSQYYSAQPNSQQQQQINLQMQQMYPAELNAYIAQQSGSSKTNYPQQSPMTTNSPMQTSKTTSKSSSWTPKFVSDFWTGAKEATQSVASYIPGHKKIGLGNIKQWSASRLLASLSAAMYGLVKLGYNYDVILELFINVATKIWDKATITNALIAAVIALGGSAAAADIAASK
jgi:hypothetical protein